MFVRREQQKKWGRRRDLNVIEWVVGRSVDEPFEEIHEALCDGVREAGVDIVNLQLPAHLPLPANNSPTNYYYCYCY